MASREATRARRGFTLIEILVVLALIAVLTGLAALSAGAGADPVTREARRLAATLKLATDESRLQGRVLGLRFHPGGYSWLELIPARPDAQRRPGPAFVWSSLPKNGVFRSRNWPRRLRFDLWIDGRRPPPEPTDANPAPQILLLPEGEFVPFSLRLAEAGAAGVTLRFDAAGRFTLED